MYRLLLFDPQLIPVIIFGTVLFCIVSVFLVGFLIHFQRKKYQHESEIRLLHETCLNTRLEIQEQTLQTISKELHDSVNADLLNVHMNLLTVRDEMSHTPAADPMSLLPKVEDTNKEVLAVIQELRQISKRLSSDYFENFGLEEAIRQEVIFINKTKRLVAVLKTEGNPAAFDKMKELVLFRILQEALNNVKKHARAKKVEISLKYEPERLTLLVADNGAGFDPSQFYGADVESGSGLRNMKSRAQQIGADFRLESEKGKGTRIYVRYPL